MVHFQTHSPDLSAIHVIECSTVVCLQCGLCLYACPVDGALKRVRRTGAIQVTEKCIGCGHCVAACPFGMITLHSKINRAIKCNLCGGDPACVKHCPYDALGYVEINKGAEKRRLGTVMTRESIKGKVMLNE